MNPLLGVLVLVLLGLLGARLSFSASRAPAGPRLLLSAGTHFLFLGFLLGSHGVDVLTRDLIDDLYPFLALGLGWIGLIFGLQLDRRHLGQFPRAFVAVALLQAIVAFGLFWGVAALLLGPAAGAGPAGRVALLSAAATACVSTPVGIALVSDSFRSRGRLTQLLFFIASLDAVVGIVALQVTYAAFHPVTGFALIQTAAAWEWLALATVVGTATGALFLGLTRPQPSRQELVLFLLGLVSFASGAALLLGHSPLFVSAVAGVLIANLSPLRRRVYSILQEWEKPIYVILLILAGALLDFPTLLVLPLGVAYLLVRIVAKLAGGFLAGRAVRLRFRPPPDLGLGLISQGGISLAMAISVTLTYPVLRVEGVPIGAAVFSVVVLGVVGSELVGPFLMRGLLFRSGEAAREPGAPQPEFPAAARRKPPSPPSGPEAEP